MTSLSTGSCPSYGMRVTLNKDMFTVFAFYTILHFNIVVSLDNEGVLFCFVVVTFSM